MGGKPASYHRDDGVWRSAGARGVWGVSEGEGDEQDEEAGAGGVGEYGEL